jgi:hypothetical protein
MQEVDAVNSTRAMGLKFAQLDMTYAQIRAEGITSPIDFGCFALEFFEAAQAVDNDVGMRPGYEIVPPVTVLYLIGHSIELSLKAFLLYRGVPLNQLRGRMYGHDLHACLSKANELGLAENVALSEDEQWVIEVLNQTYAVKELEYAVRGVKEYPTYGPLERAAVRLFNGIAPLIGHMGRIDGYLDV